MDLISWNVNGIRSVLGKGFMDFVQKENPDIICLQETKARQQDVDLQLQQYPHHLWNSAQKRGYSGTAVFSKHKPISVQLGLGIPEHDQEGRVITLEFPTYFLVTVYTPNAQRELTRLEYRQQWDLDFLQFLKRLELKKPVIFCGDLNVAHTEIDLAHPKQNVRNAGFTIEERSAFSRLLESGFIDTFRQFDQRPGQYTWWSYMMNARAKNIGWRIDYFCVSKALQPKVEKSVILPQVRGSDHCPVRMVIY